MYFLWTFKHFANFKMGNTISIKYNRFGYKGYTLIVSTKNTIWLVIRLTCGDNYRIMSKLQ